MDEKPRRRPAMLASSIRSVIAPMLRECPQECGIVSITEVTLSPEFSSVGISISALREPEAALKFLMSQRGRVRKELGSLALRKIPEIRFTIDRVIERADRIDQLLREEAEKKPGDSSRDAQG